MIYDHVDLFELLRIIMIDRFIDRSMHHHSTTTGSRYVVVTEARQSHHHEQQHRVGSECSWTCWCDTHGSLHMHRVFDYCYINALLQVGGYF